MQFYRKIALTGLEFGLLSPVPAQVPPSFTDPVLEGNCYNRRSSIAVSLETEVCNSRLGSLCVAQFYWFAFLNRLPHFAAQAGLEFTL